ncbi:DoxX family protein [Mucilaginibacter limnophilus]|uniref:DoxX family protein n=1 Tax=Mucilaginibacter limnophilus TaxID=1932778 RepID=A0A3S2VMV0_9SPHI|nr:DoxX family protein [Mucilaginibacter limnophilus]RVU01045.1 DoxX family protein [Mucilaginibacter limnophilus]
MSFFNISNGRHSEWKGYEKAALRFFFIYFIIQAVPLDWKFYRHLFSINWLHLNFYDLFSLSKYAPQFFGISGFGNWLIAAAIAAVGAIIWQFAQKREPDYDNLHYWLRVILRYRLAIGIIAYGLIKLFPLQMPYPSLSNLHTNYGDFFAWKIYFHTIGITQGYEAFLGLVEILASVLLFFRRTTTFGTGIILGFTGNVLAANFAYDAGEQVYSAYLVVIALFLFVYDVPRLFNLLIQQQYTIANKFEPVFADRNLKKLRIGLRVIFVAFVVLLGFTTYANYVNGPYKLPQTPGIKGSYGYYNVKEFRFNGQTIPYSTTDSNRWQNVVFEKWATISIKIAKPIKPDNDTGEGYYENDIDRNFESAGVGGRKYYAYTPDSLSRTIVLKNKNKNYKEEGFKLTYSQPNDSTIILKGVNEKKDSVYAELNRINRKYLLFEGRRKPIKL